MRCDWTGAPRSTSLHSVHRFKGPGPPPQGVSAVEPEATPPPPHASSGRGAWRIEEQNYVCSMPSKFCPEAAKLSPMSSDVGQARPMSAKACPQSTECGSTEVGPSSAECGPNSTNFGRTSPGISINLLPDFDGIWAGFGRFGRTISAKFGPAQGTERHLFGALLEQRSVGVRRCGRRPGEHVV